MSLSIMCRMDACRARIQAAHALVRGMEADNETRARHGQDPAWDKAAFDQQAAALLQQAAALEGLAEQARSADAHDTAARNRLGQMVSELREVLGPEAEEGEEPR